MCDQEMLVPIGQFSQTTRLSPKALRLYDENGPVHRERLVKRLAADERMLEYLELLTKRKEGVMPYTVQIDDVAPQLVAATRLHTSLRSVGDDIGAGFGRLVSALGEAGLDPQAVQPDDLRTRVEFPIRPNSG